MAQQLEQQQQEQLEEAVQPQKKRKKERGESEAPTMSQHAQKVTKWLFWAAFGVFLGVSIPHIAWVFHEYEPSDQFWLAAAFWWTLSYGYAIAIDATTAWLSHINSVMTKADRGDRIVIWIFILALVALSWYDNWVFGLAHDPSHQGLDVWSVIVFNSAWGWLPTITVGQLTPVLISALPVCIIAYTLIQGKVAKMKATDAKSVAELLQEAAEAEERAAAENRIRNAQKNAKSGGASLADRLTQGIGEARKVAGELRKNDKEATQLTRTLDLLRESPRLAEVAHKEEALSLLKVHLKVRKLEEAKLWLERAIPVLQREREAQAESERQATLEEAEQRSAAELERIIGLLKQYPSVKQQILQMVDDGLSPEAISAEMNRQYGRYGLRASAELVSRVLEAILPSVLPQALGDRERATKSTGPTGSQKSTQGADGSIEEIDWDTLPQTLSRKVAAQYLDVSDRQVSNLVKDGKLRASKAQGAVGQILTSSLKKHMEERQHKISYIPINQSLRPADADAEEVESDGPTHEEVGAATDLPTSEDRAAS